ncbi:MAG: hypothetical protein IH878_04295 [Gemmatimonadetes bacterium]|nr:hypothetical protein [Gemmatimonadota bacterium]
MPGLLWLEWQRAAKGYSICEPVPDFFDIGKDREVDEGDCFLKANSKKTVNYRPMEKFPGLFMEFAHTEQTPAGVQQFANRHGLLWKLFEEMDGEDPVRIHDWCRYIRQMGNAVEIWEKQRENGNIGDLIQVFSDQTEFSRAMTTQIRVRADICLRPVDDPMRAALYLRPVSLHGAMWAQLMEAMADNAQLRRCAQCPSWIIYGPKTGRRESAKFCSSACRRAAWKAKQESGN